MMLKNNHVEEWVVNSQLPPVKRGSSLNAAKVMSSRQGARRTLPESK
jgi:hypothetical protein